MIRGVLFVLDDTLVDHHTAASRAVVHWAHDHGLDGAADELATRWTAVSNRHYAAWQRGELTMAAQQQARAREFLPHLDLSFEEDAQATFDGYAARYREATTAYDDARPALERARAGGLRVGVLTNGDDAVQRAKLQRAGLADVVEELVASSTLGWAKPDARAFRAGCERLGLPPEQTLMVGDSLVTDVHGARAAGLPAVLLDRHGQHPSPQLRGAVRSTSLVGFFRA